jgi:hypothetical protein
LHLLRAQAEGPQAITMTVSVGLALNLRPKTDPAKTQETKWNP